MVRCKISTMMPEIKEMLAKKDSTVEQFAPDIRKFLQNIHPRTISITC
jgi:hypothetical protein